MQCILVVEDEADVLKLVTENLVIRGYNVMVAKNATEALEKIHKSTPSLMILDIKLPDFSGLELLKRMKTDPLVLTSFPVLVMTASISEAMIDRRSYPNVEEILIKPFSSSSLVAIVKLILSNSNIKV